MMNISSRSSTPPNRRRRVAPYSTDAGANQQQQQQHQFHVSDTQAVGIPSSESNDPMKNQQNRSREQFHHHKAIGTSTTSSSSSKSGTTLVAPPSKTREWRLQRFQQQLLQQKEQNQEKQLQQLSSDEYPEDEYTANNISSTTPRDIKTILSSLSDDEKCKNVYSTGIDVDEIDPNTDTDTDNDDVYEGEDEVDDDDDDINEVEGGDDSSSWYSKNTDDALESQSQQDCNEKSCENDRKPLFGTKGLAVQVATIKSSPLTKATTTTKTSPMRKLSPIFNLSPTVKTSPTASPLSIRSNPTSNNKQIDHILLPSLQQEKLVSIQSLIQNTGSSNTNIHKKDQSACESSASVVTDDDDSSTSFVSNKTTDAIGSYHIRPDIDNDGSQYPDKHHDKSNIEIHTNRLGSSLFKTLHDSGPIVVRNEFHPLRDKPLLLLPISSSQQEESICEVEDDATIKQGNVSPEAPVRRLRITKTTETVINVKKKTSIIIDNIDNHNNKNNNDIEQSSNNKSKDITFDEVANVVKTNVLRCSHVVGKNVKKVAKKVKENYNLINNNRGPATHYMTVTSPIGPTAATSTPTTGGGLALAKTNKNSNSNVLQVAKISCTTLATSEKFVSNPIFVLIDTLHEQPQALCIPSSYNQQMRKVLKHTKNNTPQGQGGNNPFCHHIDETLLDSYIIYGRKQFRTSNSVTCGNITGPPSMRIRNRPSDNTSNKQQQNHHAYNDQDLYRQQYYQRTTQSNVGGTIIASSPLPSQSYPGGSTIGNSHSNRDSVDIFRSQSDDIENEMFYYDGYKYYPWIRVVGTGNSDNTSTNNKNDDTNKSTSFTTPLTNNRNRPTSAFFQLWNGRTFIDIKQTMTISKSINVAGQQQTDLVKPTNDIVLFGDTTAPPTIAAAVSYGGKKKKRSKYSKLKQLVLPSTSTNKKSSTTTTVPTTTTTRPIVLSRIELSDQITVQQQQQQKIPSTNKNKNTIQANGSFVTNTNNTIPVDVDDDDISDSIMNNSSKPSLIASKLSLSFNSMFSTNSSGNNVISNTTTTANSVTTSLAERYYTKRITTGTTTQVKRINKNSTSSTKDTTSTTSSTNNSNKKVSKCTIRTIQRKIEEDGWNINIIPDVDPAIMLCVTVILDEMI